MTGGEPTTTRRGARVPGVERVRGSLVLQGSAWILIALGIQAVLGLAFWVLGSRVADVDQIGRASALYTAVQFVNYATGLGLTVALARHAPDASDESDRLFGRAVVATVLSSMIGGFLFLALWTSSASGVVHSPGGWILFGLYTAGSSIGLLADVRLMTARRWSFMVWRITLTGLLRLPLTQVHVAGIAPDAWLYHVMLAPLAVGGVIAALLLPRVGAGRLRFGRPEGLSVLTRYAGVNWVATLASQAPQFVLPLLVSQYVASADYANFFLPWTMTGLVFLVPGAIAQVLLVEGAKDVEGVQDHEPRTDRAREALAFSLGIALVALVGAVVVGRVLVAVFGDGYREAGRVLPLLMAAGVPWSIAAVRLSEARIRRDQLATVAITAALGLGILGPALVLVRTRGVNGAITAWLCGNVAAALVAVAFHQRRRPVARLGAASG